MKTLVSACFVVCAVLSGCAGEPAGRGSGELPLGPEWILSSAEEQDLSSRQLAAMLREVVNQDYRIDSIHIVKNGYLVLDVYRHPFEKGMLHGIHSCTKSIVSTLVGIAIDDGDITGVNEKLAATWEEANPELRIKHLLTMTTGLASRDSFLFRWSGLREMRSSNDWVSFALARPSEARPGNRFDYSNQASYLLSALVKRRTGISTEDFAAERLFAPLGIHDFVWPVSPEGIAHGWDGLQMHPLDLAKIGLLYLNKGRWDDDQIVSEKWTRDATERQVDANLLREFYGYQWWIDRTGVFMALGYAGQYLIVDAERNLVVVITSSLPEKLFGLPWSLYERYVVGAVENKQEIDLQDAIELFSEGPKSSSPLKTPMQDAVDGIEYRLEPNRFGLSGITVSFSGDEAIVGEHYGERIVNHRTGLDGRFRVNGIDGTGIVAVRGEWIDADTFIVEFLYPGQTSHTTLELNYSGDRLQGSGSTNSSTNIPILGSAVR